MNADRETLARRAKVSIAFSTSDDKLIDILAFRFAAILTPSANS
jgi:hypothetical protein